LNFSLFTNNRKWKYNLNKQELISKYVREAKNLNRNILFELNKTPWDGETDYMHVKYMQGQLSIIREIVHQLRQESEYIDKLPNDYFKIDYQLGKAFKELSD
jgi:hypothetical protein